MLVLLPILTFAMLCVLLHGHPSLRRDGLEDWRGAFLKAAVICGALVTLFSEGLGLLKAITQPWLGLCWAAALAVSFSLAWRRGALAAFGSRLSSALATVENPEKLALAGLAAIILLLLAVALASPPNNVDAQLYHMSRVVHWAQNRSLGHYATVYEHQLLKPIWAETAILNLRVLWGDDTPANLVQWFSMLASVVGVSAIAALMGVNRYGQWLAAAFAVSIPMGVLQATSAQNDYAVALWVVCAAYFVVLGKRRPLSWVENLGLGLAFGVGVLTKGTFFVYGPFLLVWHFLPLLFRRGWWRAIAGGMLVAAVTVLLNLGFWARNVTTYGGPYGTSEWLVANLPFLRRSLPPVPSPEPAPEPAAPAPASVEEIESDQQGSAGGGAIIGVRRFLGEILTGLLRNMAQNSVTPIKPVNELVFRVLKANPVLFGDALAAFLPTIPWNHEDVAGSPVHLLLVPVSIAMLALSGRRSAAGPAFRYGLVALSTYLVIPLVIGHSISPYGVRYQLPFFLLGAPVVGAGLSALGGRWLPRMTIALLLVASLPYLLFNNTRPVIGLRPWQTRVESVFRASRAELLFAMAPEARDEYEAATQAIQRLECQQVGLRIDSHDREYVIWWLLDAPQSGTRIATILTYPHLERYRDPGFKPCAIFCTVCGDRDQVHGLPRVEGPEDPAVFAGSGYVPEEGD